MSAETWYLYSLTVAAIVAVPGPSTMLVSSRALDHGVRACLATIAGDLSANVVQMLIAATSTSVVYATAPPFVHAMKWIGVAYLVFVGVRMWTCRAATDVGFSGGGPAPVRLFAEGFLVSAANPQALVFFMIVFPSFANAQASLALQTVILVATFVALDGTALLLYAIGAGRLGGGNRGRRACAAVRTLGALVLVLSGVLLALKRTV